MKTRLLLLAASFILLFTQCAVSDQDDSQLELTVVNRNLSAFPRDRGSAVQLNAQAGDGLAILNEIEFETGTIEVDLMGENNPGKSFIGIAFNIQNDSTYEAIYFRPFNFVAEEQIRKEHMVQYIFHPEYGWNRLRTERTGEFEAELPNPPNPDGWFRAYITVSQDRVQVRLSETSEPVLDVPRLSEPFSNKIGYWVGNNSSGRFDDFKIKSN
jgi:hypothetical protein